MRVQDFCLLQSLKGFCSDVSLSWPILRLLIPAMYLNSYLKEVVNAAREGKNLPGWLELASQYPRWRRYQANRNVFENAIPWIAFTAIDFLNQFIEPPMRVFEYGGGGSTIFFASRVRNLVTIEHNRKWFEGLRKEMEKNTEVKWTGRLIEPEVAASTKGLNKANPDHYYSGDESFRDCIFRQYALSIDEYPDEHFDVVLIDGRARPSCLKHSMAKVTKGGLLILDNADRPYYLECLQGKFDNYCLVLSRFGPLPYVGGFVQTNIWKRVS
jgi:hypothetical protein